MNFSVYFCEDSTNIFKCECTLLRKKDLDENRSDIFGDLRVLEGVYVYREERNRAKLLLLIWPLLAVEILIVYCDQTQTSYCVQILEQVLSLEIFDHSVIVARFSNVLLIFRVEKMTLMVSSNRIECSSRINNEFFNISNCRQSRDIFDKMKLNSVRCSWKIHVSTLFCPFLQYGSHPATAIFLLRNQSVADWFAELEMATSRSGSIAISKPLCIHQKLLDGEKFLKWTDQVRINNLKAHRQCLKMKLALEQNDLYILLVVHDLTERKTCCAFLFTMNSSIHEEVDRDIWHSYSCLEMLSQKVTCK